MPCDVAAIELDLRRFNSKGGLSLRAWRPGHSPPGSPIACSSWPASARTAPREAAGFCDQLDILADEPAAYILSRLPTSAFQVERAVGSSTLHAELKINS